MRIIADEMVSPRIVEKVCNELLSSGLVFESVRDRHNLVGADDEVWIEKFSESGGKVIISGDRAMLNREALVEGISSLGIIAIYLPAMWANSPGRKQLDYIVHWWKKIEKTITTAENGSIWMAPSSMRGGSITPWINKRAIKRARQEANRKIPRSRERA